MSDHYVDLTENYVELSDNDVDLSDIILTSRWQFGTKEDIWLLAVSILIEPLYVVSYL